ncbi:MAG: tRNA pseudouridine(55) synthase TruB [Rickettsiales bacterium]|jgi:tRNA pseudouridine55 synthase|nr:tRNA pseudouridine(55) synthase TruB [Rickettsiales bacterium]
MLELDGWLNVYKPKSFSSAGIVSILKRKLRVKKMGHGGTLDPLAVGVLPICIGKATKQTELVMNCHKEYLFNIKFGIKKSTADEEGEIIETSDFIPKEGEILKRIPEFVGIIKQTPPAFSAIKVNGKRAYQLAREGKSFVLKERDVEILDLIFKGWVASNEIQLLVKCGKGFYVRSFSEDFAKSLGALGYTSYLERVSVGIFKKESALEIDNIRIEDIKQISVDENNLYLNCQ